MENYFGFQSRRHNGYVSVAGNQKIKMTYGQEDGSTIDGYNGSGDGYIDLQLIGSGENGSFIKELKYNDYGGFVKATDGSSSTYYCDGSYYIGNQGVTGFSYLGGSGSYKIGAFYVALCDVINHASYEIGATISCKPLEETA